MTSPRSLSTNWGVKWTWSSNSHSCFHVTLSGRILIQIASTLMKSSIKPSTMQPSSTLLRLSDKETTLKTHSSQWLRISRRRMKSWIWTHALLISHLEPNSSWHLPTHFSDKRIGWSFLTSQLPTWTSSPSRRCSNPCTTKLSVDVPQCSWLLID